MSHKRLTYRISRVAGRLGGYAVRGGVARGGAGDVGIVGIEPV